MVCVEMLYTNDDDVCLHVYNLSWDPKYMPVFLLD